MLFAGKLKVVCLLVGLLAISEMGLQTVTEEVPQQAETDQLLESPVDMADTAEESNSRMREEYERLAEKEEELKAQLREKEAALDPKDEAGQVEMMDLQEKVRTIQLRMMVLKARMEETF